MNDEFESLNSRLPDLGAVLSQRIAAKTGESVGAVGQVDPYKLMLQKKSGTYKDQELPKPIQWPEEDIQKLQTYCTKMGIVGFNCGRMHPIAALAMLKKQFGEDFSDIPLEERVPSGYQKIGTCSQQGSSYPYVNDINKKQILHG